MRLALTLIIGLLALAGATRVDGHAQLLDPMSGESEEEANARHDPADPLLPAKLEWDALTDAKVMVGYSYGCNASVRDAQRMRFERRFEARLLRINERFRSEFGQEVIEHGHDIVGVGRCVQHSNGSMPEGTAAFAEELRRIERWLAMTAAERTEP